MFDIHVHPGYYGLKRQFVHDIALLRVSFVMSSVVLPICLDMESKFSLRPGDVGVVSVPPNRTVNSKRIGNRHQLGG